MIGVRDKVRKKVVSDIFEKHGLTSLNEMKKFELRLMKLSDKYFKYLPSFEEYLTKVGEKIRTGVLQLRIENTWLPINWKNNL